MTQWLSIGSLDSIGLDLFNFVFNTSLKPKSALGKGLKNNSKYLKKCPLPSEPKAKTISSQYQILFIE